MDRIREVIPAGGLNGDESSPRAVPGTYAQLVEDLRVAGRTVLDGLNARIDHAPENSVPVFDGIADLHDALNALDEAQPPNPPPESAVPQAMIGGDDFRGNTSHLISCIRALVEMNDAGALVPHGIGGHARGLLLAAANRLAQSEAVSTLPGVWDGGNWPDEFWRCPECHCRSYTHPDERQPDGSFAPGTAILCVNCKRVFSPPRADDPCVVEGGRPCICGGTGRLPSDPEWLADRTCPFCGRWPKLPQPPIPDRLDREALQKTIERKLFEWRRRGRGIETQEIAAAEDITDAILALISPPQSEEG